MCKGLFILDDSVREKIYPPAVYDAIAALVEIYAPPQSQATVKANPSILHDMDFLFTSWSCPRLDAQFLEHSPNLKVVFYGAGSIKQIVTDAFWQRGLRIAHAADANAITVAQFTVGQIILSLKGMWYYMQTAKSERAPNSQKRAYSGLYQSTVGIIGLGLIGRSVCELLQAFDPKVIAYDPHIAEEATTSLGATSADIETLFATADVVSLHAPWLPETEGMVHRKLLESMPPHSTFINTARGALVREDELIAVLHDRPDIFALLDVTNPEPPPPESPFYKLPNVILTPHMAGAVDTNDTHRLGLTVLDELRLYLRTGELRREVKRDYLKTMA